MTEPGCDHDQYQLRPAVAGETLDILSMVVAGFGDVFDASIDEWTMPRFEPDRSLVVTCDGVLVGHTGTFTADLCVPGAAVPAAFVTLVNVAPEHRRRGLLTRLMTRQLRDVRAAGREPVAVLWASEGRIYQRYGYGLASRNVRYAVESREVSFPGQPAAPGQLRTSVPADVCDPLREVYQRVAPDRPGWTMRNDRWWVARLYDPKHRREGGSPARATLYHSATGVDGYALWRMKPGFDHGGPTGEVLVVEVVAATTEASVALWRHLLTMDLTRTLRTTHGALNDPLWYLLDEPRRLRAIVADGLWLRVVDVAAALAARRYPAPVDVVIEVTDALLPENAGRYRLRAGADGRAECRPCQDPADLACDVADLGALYLGGTPLGRLADAGRVSELRPDALRGAGAAFGWHRDPGSLETF